MPQRVLVVGPAWVGDMVMAQSLFMSIKQSRAEADIDVLAPDWSLPLLARMPQVRNAISLPVKHGEPAFMKRYRLGRRLRKNTYDQAIVIPRSFKAALVPFFAGIPKRTGYRGEMRYGVLNDIRRLDKTILTQTVQRYVNLGREKEDDSVPDVPRPVLKVDRENQAQLLTQLSLNLNKPVVALMPGAEYGPAKQWSVKNYTELAKHLSRQGKQIWVFGSDKDLLLGDEIAAAGARDIINLCGKTRLEDVIDLTALCEAVVTNDSGLMHIACAVDVNIVSIYGSSSPVYTPPLSAKSRIIYKDLECSPCFQRQCPFGHTACLNNISVGEVAEVVNEFKRI